MACCWAKDERRDAGLEVLDEKEAGCLGPDCDWFVTACAACLRALSGRATFRGGVEAAPFMLPVTSALVRFQFTSGLDESWWLISKMPRYKCWF
jgi:hypothetical protein